MTTSSDIHEKHKELLQNGDDNDINGQQIINIIGGIKKILYDYLSLPYDNDSCLNQTQLQQIDEILEQKQPSIQQNTTKKQQVMTHYFCKQNTFLNCIFGEYYGNTIFTVIHSKYTTLITSIIMITYFVLQVIRTIENKSIYHSIDKHNIFDYIYGIIAFFYSMIWLLLMLLSMNIKCFCLIFKSFEFFFKIFLSLQYIISREIYFSMNDSPNEWWFVWILHDFGVFFVIILFSSLDAVQWELSVKICAGSIVSLLFTLQCIRLIFSYPDNHWFIDGYISVKDIWASSARILCIFLWKQVILSIFKKENKRNNNTKSAVFIRHKPLIKWYDANESIISNSILSVSTISNTKTSSSTKDIIHFNDVSNDMNELKLETLNITPQINILQMDTKLINMPSSIGSVIKVEDETEV